MAYAMSRDAWMRGSRPSPGDTGFAFGDNPDASGNRALVTGSSYWNDLFYRNNYPDVAQNWRNRAIVDHFIMNGGMPAEMRDPGPNFSTRAYFDHYPDVKAANVNALIHYLRHGKGEGRQIWPSNLSISGGAPAPAPAPAPASMGPSAADTTAAARAAATAAANAASASYQAAVNDANRAIAAANAHGSPDARNLANQASNLTQGDTFAQAQKAAAAAGSADQGTAQAAASAAAADAAQVKTLADQAQTADAAFAQAQADAAAAAQRAAEVAAADAASHAAAGSTVTRGPALPPASSSLYVPIPQAVTSAVPLEAAAGGMSSTTMVLIAGGALAALFLLKK